MQSSPHAVLVSCPLPHAIFPYNTRGGGSTDLKHFWSTNCLFWQFKIGHACGCMEKNSTVICLIFTHTNALTLNYDTVVQTAHTQSAGHWNAVESQPNTKLSKWNSFLQVH